MVRREGFVHMLRKGGDKSYDQATHQCGRRGPGLLPLGEPPQRLHGLLQAGQLVAAPAAPHCCCCWSRRGCCDGGGGRQRGEAKRCLEVVTRGARGGRRLAVSLRVCDRERAVRRESREQRGRPKPPAGLKRSLTIALPHLLHPLQPLGEVGFHAFRAQAAAGSGLDACPLAVLPPPLLRACVGVVWRAWLSE